MHICNAETEANRSVAANELEDNVEDIEGRLICWVIDLAALDDADEPQRET